MITALVAAKAATALEITEGTGLVQTQQDTVKTFFAQTRDDPDIDNDEAPGNENPSAPENGNDPNSNGDPNPENNGGENEPEDNGTSLPDEGEI